MTFKDLKIGTEFQRVNSLSAETFRKMTKTIYVRSFPDRDSTIRNTLPGNTEVYPYERGTQR